MHHSHAKCPGDLHYHMDITISQSSLSTAYMYLIDLNIFPSIFLFYFLFYSYQFYCLFQPFITHLYCCKSELKMILFLFVCLFQQSCAFVKWYNSLLTSFSRNHKMQEICYVQWVINLTPAEQYFKCISKYFIVWFRYRPHQE